MSVIKMRTKQERFDMLGKVYCDASSREHENLMMFLYRLLCL